MTLDDILIDPSEYSAFPLEESLVVIRKGVDRLFILNETAQLIWNALMAQESLDEIASGLSEQFGIPIQQAKEDIEVTIAEWRDEGLIGRKEDETGKANPQASDFSAFLAASVESYSECNYRMCGVPFTIRYATSLIKDNIHRRIAGLAADKVKTAPTLTVDEVAGGGYLISGDDEVIVWGKEVWNIEAMAHVWVMGTVHHNHKWLIILHAAVVSDGKNAIVFPAHFGSGKSTLSLALAYAGLKYFSDDMAPITFDGRVFPYPVDIGLKEGSWEVARRYDKKVDQLPRLTREDGVGFLYYPPPMRSCDDSPSPASIKYIVFPKYTPGVKAELTPVTAVEALTHLTYSESKIMPEPEKVERFVKWVGQTPAFTFVYDDLDEAVSIVKELFEKK